MRVRAISSIFLLTSFVAICHASDPAGSPHVPFSFVENRGEFEPGVRYVGTGPDFKAWFGNSGVVFQQGSAQEHVDFVGGAPEPLIEALEPTGARANYFRGHDRSRWVSDLPLFAGLRYRDVWRGIEIRFKADSSATKAEYVVAPGAAISQIRLRFDGQVAIEKNGTLIVSNASGQFREDKPVLFQDIEGERTNVAGEFRAFEDGTIGFQAGVYNSSKPLVVDPSILFSGYIGGASQTTITSLAVNSYYNIIVAGWTLGTDLSTPGSAQARNQGGVDAFVAGFSPAGGGMIFCTYLGGSGDDRAFGVAVDSLNNTYVTGWTSSSNFPVTGGALQRKSGGSRDAFVTKLDPAGDSLIFSTYLGGSGVDSGNSIVLDSNNQVIIAGDTTSLNLPVTSGAFQRSSAGAQDSFVAKLSPGGNAISYLTYYGGSATDHCTVVKVDSVNQIYIAGSTYSTNLPMMRAAQPQSGGGQDGYFAKFSTDLSTLLVGTYIGGSGGSAGLPEQVNGMGAPVGIAVTLVGTTSSVDFPVTATSFQKTFGGGNTDGFVMAININTGAVIRATYVGGSLDDGINAVAVDADGYLYIAGYTASPDFPVLRPFQSANAGAMDAFVAKLTAARILYGTYLGGNGNDSANAITVDSRTSVVVAGTTASPNFPVTGNVGHSGGAMLSSFITKIAPNFHLAVVAAPLFIFDVWNNSGYNGPNITLNSSVFGNAGDIPVAGDWTGTGKKAIGVFRNGTWYLDTNNNGVLDAADKTVAFGQAGDLPVVGDWDGTGHVKLGLFRSGTFILDLSGHLSGIPTGQTDSTFAFGLASDLPVAADWNNTGTTKVGVFRNGSWLVDYNGDRVFNSLDMTYTLGQAGDLPVIGDWDSTGSDKIGVYRNGVWILNYTGAGWDMFVGFGSSSYVPLVY